MSSTLSIFVCTSVDIRIFKCYTEKNITVQQMITMELLYNITKQEDNFIRASENV